MLILWQELVTELQKTQHEGKARTCISVNYLLLTCVIHPFKRAKRFKFYCALHELTTNVKLMHS